MPSELQRVARGLVDCFDEIPRVVEQLVRTAARCRENAQVALIASRGQATVAAQQLDAAARACEAAAHYLQLAPPKARAWAEGLIGTPGPSTSRPSSDSADRNRLPRGAEIRTTRLTATYEDLEVAEDNEPPVVTVARKAFEKYRKTVEKDDDQDPREPLEIEITITETGEIIVEERDEKEEEKREERLTRDFEFTPDRDGEDLPPEYEERNEKEEAEREKRLTTDHVIDTDLTEAVKALLASMPPGQQWQHATITITPESVEATFDHSEQPRFNPIVVDIQLPDRPNLRTLDFDPAFDPRPLDADFAPGTNDPENSFKPHERAIADRLAEEGWRVDSRRADHSTGEKKTDAMVRKHRDLPGVVVEFKTPNRNGTSTLKRNICDASGQAPEIVIDGRGIELSEADALRAYRRALGQPGKTIADIVHV
ncbi:MAG: hypothetical protein HOV67_17270, partial [Kribbellaceae bacterium]|nr:hypothetical protein [Kribbellaceae bacterium]